MLFPTDRSRIVQFQRCPRSRYWGYQYLGRGITSKAWNEDIAIGNGIHEGLDRLILGNSLESTIDDSIQVMKIDSGEEDTREASWIVEALLRVFYLRGLGPFLDMYEILETEQELETPLSEYIMLLARYDALLKDKETGDLYTGSWKSTKTYDMRKERFHSKDTQGITEPYSASVKLGQVIHGTQMLYLLTGSKWENKEGVRERKNELVYGWYNEVTTEWAHSYDWICQAEHSIGKGKSCPGLLTNHKLGKGWRKLSIQENYAGGIQQWIYDLSLGDVQPAAKETETVLDKFIVMPPPITRHAWEIESKLAQIENQEKSIWRSLIDENIDHSFPQFEHSCTYPSVCQYWDLCWRRNPGQQINLDEWGMKLRTPNHPSEIKYLTS